MSCGCGSNGVEVGTAPAVHATFRDSDGDLTDPTAITVTTQDPAGVQTTYSTPHSAITSTSTGEWVFQFPTPLTVPGKWWVRWSATGGITLAAEVSFLVARPRVSV